LSGIGGTNQPKVVHGVQIPLQKQSIIRGGMLFDTVSQIPTDSFSSSDDD